jgi:formate dehydrogenase gamma subunit
MAEEQKSYVRFPVAQRIEHIILLVSFFLLGLTGLVQKFAGSPIAESLIQLLGGVENVRVIHHASAIVFALLSIYHVIELLYKMYVRRVELTMLPGLRDVTDALDVVRYNLGLTKEHPKLPRYNFAEKAEYWALVWGGIVMGLTGFILWNPIAVAKILPGQVIPAAKAAHGLEAILAVLAIFIWHFYSVHVKLFNRSMFNGKMTRKQMEEEHGEELERLERGDLRPAPPPEVIRRRERIFIPFALIATIVMVGILFLLVTAETTAISTVPPAVTNVPVFSPLTPTPVATPVGGVDNTKVGAAMKHEIVGKEQCLTCHGPKGISPMPSNHEGRPQESCLVCHKPGPTPTPGAAAPRSGAPGAIPHAVEGKEKCDMCHAGAGSLKPVPTDHAGRANNTCIACHKPAGDRATPAAEATKAPVGAATAASPAAGGPKPIPANHDLASVAYKDCTLCHGQGKARPAPANHSTFTLESCTVCHKPATAAAATSAPGPAVTATATASAMASPPAASTAGATAVATPAIAATATSAATPAASPAAGGPKPIPANHDLTSAAYKDCALCHGEGKAKPNPANHATFTLESCQLCHKPGAAPASTGAVATPAAVPTAAATVAPAATVTVTPAASATAASAAGGPKPIPANHDLSSAAYKDCTLCHGEGKVKPNPANHATFTLESCQLCHKPAP